MSGEQTEQKEAWTERERKRKNTDFNKGKKMMSGIKAKIGQSLSRSASPAEICFKKTIKTAVTQ